MQVKMPKMSTHVNAVNDDFWFYDCWLLYELRWKRVAKYHVDALPHLYIGTWNTYG